MRPQLVSGFKPSTKKTVHKAECIFFRLIVCTSLDNCTHPTELHKVYAKCR